MSKFAPHRSSYNNPRTASTTVCQKCLGTGHYTYECKSTRPYVSRPSRTEMLENPRLLAKLKAEGKPSMEVPEDFKKKSGTANLILEAKEKEREKQKATGSDARSSKKARRSSRSSDSESSSESDSDSSTSGSSTSESDSGSYSSSESSRSRERSERRRIPQRHDSRSRSSTRSPSSDASNRRN